MFLESGTRIERDGKGACYFHLVVLYTSQLLILFHFPSRIYVCMYVYMYARIGMYVFVCAYLTLI